MKRSKITTKNSINMNIHNNSRNNTSIINRVINKANNNNNMYSIDNPYKIAHNKYKNNNKLSMYDALASLKSSHIK